MSYRTLKLELGDKNFVMSAAVRLFVNDICCNQNKVIVYQRDDLVLIKVSH